jgi:hypothetical protein
MAKKQTTKLFIKDEYILETKDGVTHLIGVMVPMTFGLLRELTEEKEITDERLRDVLKNIDACNEMIGTTWIGRDDDKAVAILRALINEVN